MCLDATQKIILSNQTISILVIKRYHIDAVKIIMNKTLVNSIKMNISMNIIRKNHTQLLNVYIMSDYQITDSAKRNYRCVIIFVNII